MAYTPTQWNTGDTVTATKLNKLEQGVANAGSGGVASIRLSALGFNSSSHCFGYIVYAYRDNNTWVLSNDSSEPWITLSGYGEPFDRLVNVLIPSDPNVGVFLVDHINDAKSIIGDISSTAETVYFSWGSTMTPAYRITGNGSFEFIAT